MSEAKARASKVLPVTPEQERNYHRAMARLTAARGFMTLSEAHAVAAKDCPAGCGCEGCIRTRAVAREIREERDARRLQTQKPRAAA